jgi:hypothetical protein
MPLSDGMGYESGKLYVLYRATMLQIAGRVVNQTKGDCAFIIYRDDLIEHTFIEHYRFEEQHAEVACTRLHRFMATAKHRHPKMSMIVEREPIPVGSLHNIHLTHCIFLDGLAIRRFP